MIANPDGLVLTFVAALAFLAIFSGWYAIVSRKWCESCAGWGRVFRGTSRERACPDCHGACVKPEYQANFRSPTSPLTKSEHPANFPRPRGVRTCERCDGSGRIHHSERKADDLFVRDTTRMDGEYLTCPGCSGWGRSPA